MLISNRKRSLRIGRIIVILAALPFIRFTSWRTGGGTAWAATGNAPDDPGMMQTQVVIIGKKVTMVGEAGSNTGSADRLNSIPKAFHLVDQHLLVPWGDLSGFPYATPEVEAEVDPDYGIKLRKKYRIPGFIRELNGVKVAIIGFLIPLDLDPAGRKAVSFILAKSQATCCFGIAPRMNEWMFVKMEPGKTTDAVMDVPVTVFGTLEVGEARGKDEGWSLYRMTSSKVAFPKDSFW
jgi:hypothetical protein